MSVFACYRPTLKTRLQLTSPQMALILALERVCQAAGFWIVCPDCAREHGTYKHLTTANGPEDAIWRMDCPCTERRFTRASFAHSMIPSGDLLTVAETLLPAAKLAVRCPVKRTGCLTTPLQLTQRPDGVTARCQCWMLELGSGIYRFTKKTAVPS